MEARSRNSEYSEVLGKVKVSTGMKNTQGRLLFINYSSIYFRGRLLISGGDIFTHSDYMLMLYLCNCLLSYDIMIANSYQLYMFLSSSKRGSIIPQNLPTIFQALIHKTA